MVVDSFLEEKKATIVNAVEANKINSNIQVVMDGDDEETISSIKERGALREIFRNGRFDC